MFLTIAPVSLDRPHLRIWIMATKPPVIAPTRALMAVMMFTQSSPVTACFPFQPVPFMLCCYTAG